VHTLKRRKAEHHCPKAILRMLKITQIVSRYYQKVENNAKMSRCLLSGISSLERPVKLNI
jgi:hypothetical protein